MARPRVEVAHCLPGVGGSGEEHTLVIAVPDAIRQHLVPRGAAAGIDTVSRSGAVLSRDESVFCQAGNQPCIG